MENLVYFTNTYAVLKFHESMFYSVINILIPYPKILHILYYFGKQFGRSYYVWPLIIVMIYIM